MSTTTSHYNLVKPAGSETYDVSVQNGNMDKIEAALSANEVAITLDTSKVAVRSWGVVRARKVADMLFVYIHGLYALKAISNETNVATISGVSNVPTVSVAMKVDGQSEAGVAMFSGNSLRLINVQNADKAMYGTIVACLR